ncbi:hypothetical protein M3Y94_00309700 [Aphelenchoides besseyi]|nr:hypothetical protein M3Y94_00309700 [Aphelenchoides besseyi]
MSSEHQKAASFVVHFALKLFGNRNNFVCEQFRLTVRQLFSSKPLFIAQAQATFHGGKRYSLVLIDVDPKPKRFSLRRHVSNQSSRKSSSSTILPSYNQQTAIRSYITFLFDLYGHQKEC